MRPFSLLLTACLFTAPLLSGCIDASTQNSTAPIGVISEHVRAFNAGDVEAMSKQQHPNIEWLSVNGANISVQVSGRDALARNMTKYFNSPTKVTNTLRNWSINTPYVSVTETASWTAKDGTPKSQRSLTVYQMEDNLIRRVWYYPAVDNFAK